MSGGRKRSESGGRDPTSGLDAAVDGVVCRECDGVFDLITGTHLSLHGMTVEEYKAEYPSVPLAGESFGDRGVARDPGPDMGVDDG